MERAEAAAAAEAAGEDLDPTTHTPSSSSSLSSSKVPTSHPQSSQPPRFHLVLVNIQKFQNVWNMIRAAMAFGCHKILLVGQANNWQKLVKKIEADIAEQYIVRFGKWKECLQYLQTKQIHLIGVEIDETSKPFHDDYFATHFPAHHDDVEDNKNSNDDIGILMGNEANGILPKFQQECASLIRIPQYGSGTASLNVNVAANIILHRFSVWKRTRMKHEK